MAYFTQNTTGPVNAPGQNPPPDNKPQVDKVVSEFQVKPKSTLERFRNAFLPQDWAAAAWGGFTRTIVPGAKNLILQGLIATFTGMIYGGGQTPPPTYNQPGGYVHYGGMYQQPGGYNPYYGYSNVQQAQAAQNVPPRRPEYFQVALPAGQMEVVKAKMLEYVNVYSWCSVGVFYDLCGITCEYTDRNLGWTAEEIQAAMPTHSHNANGVNYFSLSIAKPSPIRR